MTWGKKNQQFALSVGLRPSTTTIAQCILRRVKQHGACEITIDFQEINKQIGKHRYKGQYDRKTVKSAIAQLDNDTYGWFTVTKSWSWKIKTILVRSVDFAQEIKTQSLGIMPKLKADKPMFDAQHKERARELLLQNMSTLDRLLQKVGLHYTQDALLRLWRMSTRSIDNVRDAVRYMLIVHHQKLDRAHCIEDARGVFEPKGWLHDCIKYGWHLKAETIELPRFNSISGIVDFIKQPLPT